MFGSRIILKKGSKDEAEKPFWISYADLMTSLMVLFLVVMSVALLTVTKKLDETLDPKEEQRKIERDKEEQQKTERSKEIDLLLGQIAEAASAFSGMRVDRDERTINFGPRAQFEFKSYLVSSETATQLRVFTRKLLDIARQNLGQKWLKRVVIEGYTDKRGDYLYNLNLSLNRSHRVLCVLFEQTQSDPNILTETELQEVRKLFLVGGYSSNLAMHSLEASRRIELRLEFLARGEPHQGDDDAKGKHGECELDKKK